LRSVLGLYLRTARYYKPSQIAGRLRMGMDRLLTGSAPWLTRLRYAVPAGISRDESATFFSAGELDFGRDLTPLRENAERLGQGTFRLLNKEFSLGSPVIWDPAGTTRLWRYNLHYFDYALDLAVLAKWEKDDRAAELLGNLFHEWIDANPVGEGVGWHAYPISRRIVNWVQSVSLASPKAVFQDSESETAWLASLYQQTRFLEDHLEFDLLGNHLLANAKALVFAGIYFGGKAGTRWFETGQRLLWRGLQDQILEDGGHHERSPMYHAGMLQDYLEVILVEQLNHWEVPAWVRDRLICMADFLSGITHPDGEIPLFADSAFGVVHKTGDILAAAERILSVPGRWAGADPGAYCALFAPQILRGETTAPSLPPSRNAWPDAGYVALSGAGPGDKLIVDAKPMGPDHLPAHGHCSLFSYELSIAGKRLIVDSGVEEYEPGPWRDFWRSTRAHNTVLVDGAEQSEIWAAFRVGRRTRLLECARLQQNSSSLFVGVHSGFVGQRKATLHRRFIAALAGGLWLVLDDVIGEGRHAIESLVHLAPNADCRIGEAYTDVFLESVKMRVYPYRHRSNPASAMSCIRGQEDPIQGWYAPEFGKRMPNSVLSFSSDTPLPARLGYLFAPADREISSWNIDVNDLGRPIHVDVSVFSPQGDVFEKFDERKATSVQSLCRFPKAVS
jgi:uncharacterized heparinase superfamily protein